MPSTTTTRRLAVAASDLSPGIHPDDAQFSHFLPEMGVAVTAQTWDDPSVDWTAYDAVLIRTTWDYFQKYTAFLDWLTRLERLRVPTINSVDLLRWNSDKRYLLQLPHHDVAIIPTRVSPGTQLADTLQPLSGDDVVIKPTVSGTAWHTVRGIAGSAELAGAVAQLPRDMVFLIQPFMPEIERDGELSLLFFGGRFSHAVRKRPAANDYRVQSEFGGSVEIVTPRAQTLAAASRALDAVSKLGHPNGSYARIDGVESGGRFLIMEVEMIEPALYFEGDVHAAHRFAEVIVQELERLQSLR